MVSIFVFSCFHVLLSHAELLEDGVEHTFWGHLADDVAQVVDTFAEVLADEVAAQVVVQARDDAADALAGCRECLVVAEVADDDVRSVGGTRKLPYVL